MVMGFVQWHFIITGILELEMLSEFDI